MVSAGLSVATVAENNTGFLGGNGGRGIGIGPRPCGISITGCPALLPAGAGRHFLSAANALAATIDAVANRAMIVPFIFVTSLECGWNLRGNVIDEQSTAGKSSKTPHFITNVKLRRGKQGLWLA